MTDVTPFLWFDDSAEAAITFYTALIPDSEVVSIGRYPDEVPGMGGKVMHAHFRLAGRDYYAMDAGPQFPFTEAISLYVVVRRPGRGRPLLGGADRRRRRRSSRAAGSRTAGGCRGRSCPIGSSS